MLRAVAAAAGVTAPMIRAEPVSGGTYNAVYRLRFAGHPGVVVKVGPDPAAACLTYERGLLAAEALFYERAATRGLPVPDVLGLVVGPPAPAGGALVVGELPGTPWAEVAEQLPGHTRRRLRTDLGALVAALHSVEGERFGYPSASTGPAADDWPTAFGGMLAAVLADAERFGVPLPVATAAIRALTAACQGDLAEVTVPALVHFDLWDGNILLDGTGESAAITGLVDGERCLWGDPLAELVSLALLGDAADDADLLAGYTSAGGSPDVTSSSARRRLLLYRVYLGVIMLVEAAPRGYGDDPFRAEVRRQLGRDAAELRERLA